MKKALLPLAAAGMLVAASAAMPSAAYAGCWGCGFGAGLFGGLVAGTIVGSAIAGPPPYYYYDEPPPYYYDGPEYGPECHLAPGKPYWNGTRWVHPRVKVCP